MFGIVLLHGVEVFADDGCCNCPQCGNKICVAKPVTKTEKKTVFAVEKKEICIPKVRFPWQIKRSACGNGCGNGCCDKGCDASGKGTGAGLGSCADCAPKCGRVRTVKVLKKKSIECKKCGYEWEIKTVESVPCNTCGVGGLLSSRAKACDNGCDKSGKQACDSSYFKDSPKPVKEGNNAK